MNPVFNAMIYAVWFLATYYTVFFFISLFVYKKKLFEYKKSKITDLVTILVPVYNEGEFVVKAINSLKKITYKNVEILILNDGSTDNTRKLVPKCIKGDARFRFIDRSINLGKAKTLNEGIKLAKGEYIACMDGDSLVEPDILTKALPYFVEKEAGAVTVSVEVYKPKTWLHKIIALEFNLGLSLFLKVFSFLDSIFVTPGPFSIYRKSVLKKIGGFDPNNITEDYEIAFRIHKAGFKIRNAMEAKVFTELPEKFKGIYVQRRRWYSGSLETVIQHREMLFRKKYGLFGFFIPYNFFLICSGLFLFGFTTYLTLSKLFENLYYYRYTGFNFFEHWRFEFDILKYGQVNVLGASMLLATVLLMIIGIKFTRKKFRANKLGLIGYPFLFFYYQIFWGGAILAVLRGKKVKWR